MPQKISTTAERLQQIIRERGMKQIDIINACKPFCNSFGIKIGRSDLSQYVSGKVEPKQDKLSVLGMALGVSETWLMGYDTPATVTSSEPQKEDVADKTDTPKMQTCTVPIRTLNPDGSETVEYRTITLPVFSDDDVKPKPKPESGSPTRYPLHSFTPKNYLLNWELTAASERLEKEPMEALIEVAKRFAKMTPEQIQAIVNITEQFTK